MAHSGPFRCECGQLHGLEFQGPSNDLLPYIDTPGVSALNESVGGACRRVFKPYDQRLEHEGFVDSEDDDPQLLLHIPFTCPVNIRSLHLVGGEEGATPRELRAFVNHETLDFSDAELMPPVQQWDIAPTDPTGTLEYPTQFTRFKNVTRLYLFVANNHGAEQTRIRYIGLKGTGTDHKREAVKNAVYELKPTPETNALKDQTSARIG
uniref:PITH domain-containing protein n=1 Tax=Coccolithus braarudii TaxID=221442 RepID=A0A7S0L3Y3_9EUKA|mmetsp:Transcript_19018/g.40963  ORF Transcript_19018/g.40963 Transcript_19018/m.40963 type:complete len:208 (+) Transcript_19018:21-644(+)